MIQLSFHDSADHRVAAFAASDFRITGGVVWDHVEHGLIACYVSGSWRHRGSYFPGVSFAGECCLAFGIARDALVSEPMSLFSITGTTFRANGVAIAEYEEKQDIWHGLIRPITWQSMRIVSAAAASALGDSTRPVILNPWDYPGDTSPSAFFSSK
ncbi:MAG TPA: hypothetical protein VGN43_19065 [Steroidobacteraceae bacterium]|jgi:hypothetical protein|nr:hypothetical protein [Steroidobacteraceae bacterium]